MSREDGWLGRAIHQTYGNAPIPSARDGGASAPTPGTPTCQLIAPDAFDAEADAGGASQRLSAAVANWPDYSAVFLTHGTFVGVDPLSLLRKVGRVWRRGAERLESLQKQAIDRWTGDAGNFTATTESALRAALRAAGRDALVERFHWSGQNHHIGRAEAAVRLLARLEAFDGARVLLIGHSHGGNVLALLTQLRAGSADFRGAFFDAAQRFYRWPLSQRIDLPCWPAVAAQLKAGWTADCDILTLGAPVRYGWAPLPGERLLHVVNHRPSPGLPPWAARFPPSVGPGHGGDLIQQLGIAGTNLPPSWLSWRARHADRRLARLLEGPLPRRSLWQRLAAGRRVHDTGHSALCDYAPADPQADALFGHAVYTRRRWLAFHAELLRA